MATTKKSYIVCEPNDNEFQIYNNSTLEEVAECLKEDWDLDEFELEEVMIFELGTEYKVENTALKLVKVK